MPLPQQSQCDSVPMLPHAQVPSFRSSLQNTFPRLRDTYWFPFFCNLPVLERPISGIIRYKAARVLLAENNAVAICPCYAITNLFLRKKTAAVHKHTRVLSVNYHPLRYLSYFQLLAIMNKEINMLQEIVFQTQILFFSGKHWVEVLLCHRMRIFSATYKITKQAFKISVSFLHCQQQCVHAFVVFYLQGFNHFIRCVIVAFRCGLIRISLTLRVIRIFLICL